MELWCTELASRVCDREVAGHNCSFKCVKHERRKWASVSTAVAVGFEKASVEQLQEGTRRFLQKHCEGCSMLRRHDGRGWPGECARRGLGIAGGCAMFHECDMFGSDNYVDTLHSGGYE